MLIHEDHRTMTASASRWCARWGARLYAYHRRDDGALATSTLPALGIPGWRHLGHFEAPLDDSGVAIFHFHPEAFR